MKKDEAAEVVGLNGLLALWELRLKTYNECMEDLQREVQFQSWSARRLEISTCIEELKNLIS